MDFLNHKVLVTGADGFIGSHLTEELVRRGCSVRAFIYYNSFHSKGWLDHIPDEIKSEIEFIPGDIRDFSRVRQAAKGSETVFHLAALIAIPYSYYAPASYVDTNIHGTLNVLQAARELEIQKIVHTSTSEVYGTAKYVPISEEHPLRGQSPYSASKIGADQLALSFYDTFSTPIAIIRPFNTYGPRQSTRAVIPAIITQIAGYGIEGGAGTGKSTGMLKGETNEVKPGTVKVKLGALTPTRDFNFIKDTVRGFIEVAQTDETTGEVVNIGSDFEISIGETARIIAGIMGKEIDVETDAERLRPVKSEVERLWADISKAKKLFGWQPEYGGKEGFIRGLQETVDWFCDPEHLKLYQSGGYNL